MRYVLSAVMAVVCYIVAYFTLDADFVHKQPLLCPKNKKEDGPPESQPATEPVQEIVEPAQETATEVVESSVGTAQETVEAAAETSGTAQETVEPKVAEPEKKPSGIKTPADTLQSRKNTKRILLAVLLGLLSAVTAWSAWGVEDPVQICKYMIALVCLVGSGCVDFLEYRIPNVFPLTIFVSGVILAAVGYMVGQNGAMLYFTSGLVTSLVCFIVFYITESLSKGGIGMGDVKLLASLGILCGVSATSMTLFYCMLISVVAAIGLVLAKKATWKSALPFGPFIMFGYMAAICTQNYGY